jgi:pimeloyl-ACP methyl ester carboxylesterase
MNSKTIVFIHGMYMSPKSWEKWIHYFELDGYTCLAPAWPGRDLPVETLRQQYPDPGMAKVDLDDVVEKMASVVNELPEKPVLIGHSMGGLVVQLLLQKRLGAAGVAIDSAPPMGVLSIKWSFLKSNLPHISPFASMKQPIEMSFPRFQYTFVNGMTLEEQHKAYDKYVVPESRRVPWQSLTARIDFKRAHPPLLLIAGSSDHLIPASLNKRNYRRYKSSQSVTVFKEFPGRTHYIIGQKNWEEVADFVAKWLKSLEEKPLVHKQGEINSEATSADAFR